MATEESGHDQATTMLEPEAFLASLRTDLPEVLALGTDSQTAQGPDYVSRRERMLAQIRLVDPDAFKQLIEDRHAKAGQPQGGGFTETDYLDLFALREVIPNFEPQSDDPINAFKKLLGNFLLTNLLGLPLIARQLQTSITYARTNASDPNLEVASIKANEYANTILQFAIQRIKREQQQ